MAGTNRWEVEVDAQTLKRVVTALRKESDGKELARDLRRNLRVVVQPALEAARAAILTMPSQSVRQPSLRASVAKQTKIVVRTTGRHPGISIVSSKKGMPRGFRNAARHLNAKGGWRHPVYQRISPAGKEINVWVRQIGKPGWFDGTIRPFKQPAKEAAAAALREAARRIEERSKI